MDLAVWLISLAAQQGVSQAVNANINVLGPTYSYDEPLLTKALATNEINASPEQLVMLAAGPVYLTQNGISPVAENRPYRLNDNGHQSELLFLITTNMPADYLQAIAEASVKTKGVLVLRGLVNNSVDETIKAVQPLLNIGALIQINPVPAETFRQRTYRKAPVIVATQINAQGNYGCESSTDKDCIPYYATGGVIHRPFGAYEVAPVIKMMIPLEKYGTNPANKSFSNVMNLRYQGFGQPSNN